MENKISAGQQLPTSGASEFNELNFVIRQALGKLQTATLVRVVKVKPPVAGSPVGFIDVSPMVEQMDMRGDVVPHATIFNIPYLRMQGGVAAVIIDPVAGDIGVCVFANRDIEKVKKTRKQSAPNTFRRFNFADGMYIGGMLNTAPVHIVKISDAGIEITSPALVSVTSPNINLGAAGAALHQLVNDTFVALYNSHTHPVSGAVAGSTAMQSTANITQNLRAS